MKTILYDIKYSCRTLGQQSLSSLMIVGILTLIGLVGTFALMRCLFGMLYQISATDPVKFVVVPMILLVVAMLACYIPARRAARIDPMEALRYE